jgi:hypothetical protein
MRKKRFHLTLALIAPLAVGATIALAPEANGAVGIGPPPTRSQVSACVRAVTGSSTLSAGQVVTCLAVVRGVAEPLPCSWQRFSLTDPLQGHLVNLTDHYEGIHGKATHLWAIRAGRKPVRVTGSESQGSMIKALCR